MFFRLTTLILLSIASSAQASQWSFRAGGDLGYTSNANYESTNEDGDLFWAARLAAMSFVNENSLNFSVRYKDYFSESQNDVTTWKAEVGVPRKLKGFDDVSWNIAVGGQHYNNTPPAFTEDSFDFFYLETSLAMTREISSNKELFLEPGAQVKEFANFDGRTDFLIYADAELAFHLPKEQTLTPVFGIGWVSSSDDLYSRRYVEVGAEWTKEKFVRDLRLSSSLIIRNTVFPDRSVSDPTAISKGQGKSGSGTSAETQALTQLSGALTKVFKSFEVTGSLVLNSQNSKSGIEDYSEMVIMASALMRF